MGLNELRLSKIDPTKEKCRDDEVITQMHASSKMAKTRAIVECLLTLMYEFWKTLIFAVIPSGLRTPKTIKGEIALITGGGNGLGREMALKLAKLGVSVVVWDVDETGLRETCDRIRSEGGRAEGYRCDVSSREEIYRVAAEVKREVGVVSILVNNAGIANGKTLLDIPDWAIEKVLSVNLASHFWTCKAFLPDMIAARRGHVVAVASLSGYVAVNRAADYGASKHGVVGFMDALKLELLELGVPEIKTTTVCTYFTNTGMFTCKYDGLIPFLETADVVNETMQGILLEKERVVVPRISYLYILCRVFLTSESAYSLNNIFSGRKLMETIKLTRSPSE